MPKETSPKEDNISVELQPLSRYLYTKAQGAKEEFMSAILTQNEILFLRKYDVPYHKVADTYQVDASRLKTLFCH